jgi:putative transposase
MSINPIPYNRRSVRLVGYDYSSPGAYFVTVVTHKHLCKFGRIISGKMEINALGKIIQDCWVKLPDHFPDIEIEPFVVMPNHIHGIISIYEKDCSRGTIYRAPTPEKFAQPVVGSIPTIIRTYKAAVSRNAKRELGLIHIWQRNYYEHIIRNPSELASIAEYILSNPDHWTGAPEHIQ